MADFYYKEMGPDGDIQVVVLSGHLDSFHCDYLFDCVERQIEEGYTKLILDCNELDYVSSMGLGMLLRAHSRMTKHGGNVKLAGVQGKVANVIQLVGLDKILQMYPDVDAAVAAHQEQ